MKLSKVIEALHCAQAFSRHVFPEQGRPSTRLHQERRRSSIYGKCIRKQSAVIWTARGR